MRRPKLKENIFNFLKGKLEKGNKKFFSAGEIQGGIKSRTGISIGSPLSTLSKMFYRAEVERKEIGAVDNVCYRYLDCSEETRANVGRLRVYKNLFKKIKKNEDVLPDQLNGLKPIEHVSCFLYTFGTEFLKVQELNYLLDQIGVTDSFGKFKYTLEEMYQYNLLGRQRIKGKTGYISNSYFMLNEYRTYLSHTYREMLETWANRYMVTPESLKKLLEQKYKDEEDEVERDIVVETGKIPDSKEFEVLEESEELFNNNGTCLKLWLMYEWPKAHIRLSEILTHGPGHLKNEIELEQLLDLLEEQCIVQVKSSNNNVATYEILDHPYDAEGVAALEKKEVLIAKEKELAAEKAKQEKEEPMVVKKDILMEDGFNFAEERMDKVYEAETLALKGKEKLKEIRKFIEAHKEAAVVKKRIDALNKANAEEMKQLLEMATHTSGTLLFKIEDIVQQDSYLKSLKESELK